MTALLLHGIVPTDAPVPRVAPPHGRVAAGRLAAIATPVTPRLLGVGEDPPIAEAEAHHGLLSAYALAGDVLPVRFGTVFSGEPALSGMLLSDAHALLPRLDRVAGCVEYTLSLTAAPNSQREESRSPAAEEIDGRAFLRRKRAVRDGLRNLSARRAAFGAAVPDRLAAAIADVRQIEARGAALGAYALLVERVAVPELLRSARELGSEADSLGLDVTLRGPGPCYAFASGDVGSTTPDFGIRASEKDKADA